MIDHEEARLSLADLLVEGLAEPTRSAAIRAHVAACDECRADLAELQRVDDALRAAGPLPEASPELEARILAIAGGERRAARLQAVPAPADREPGPIHRREPAGVLRLWGNLGAWRVAAAAAAVLAVAAYTSGRDGGFSQQQQIALQAAPGWHVQGDAKLGREDGRQVVRVRLRGLRKLPTGSYYELWLARTPQDRVSLGAVPVSADGTLAATVAVPALESGYKGVWLTAEPDDQNPAWSHDWVVKARFA